MATLYDPLALAFALHHLAAEPLDRSLADLLLDFLARRRIDLLGRELAMTSRIWLAISGPAA
jgi:hypothetical protein